MSEVKIMSKKGLHFLAPPKPSTILFSALLFITGVIQAQERIGVAAAVDTTTTDLTLEQERKLVDEGYKIIQNHTIETDENGKAQMLLVDGTAFTVGPNSSVTLDSFIYNPETAEGSLTVTSKGLMRLVGGKVTKITLRLFEPTQQPSVSEGVLSLSIAKVRPPKLRSFMAMR